MPTDTPICDYGWKAQPFSLKDPGGQEYAMADLMGENGLLIAFICNHCPYVVAIIDRLVSDIEVLRECGVGALAVMPNDYERYAADAPPQMMTFAQERGFSFPYLIDDQQSVARAYGAVCTPDFFGFNSSFELQYRGRLDDAGRGDPTGRTPELVNAMKQVAKTGQGPQEQIPSMGCSIKWR
ncbi:MAG: thioredoxin family protein [Stappiaceae bacterium]